MNKFKKLIYEFAEKGYKKLDPSHSILHINRVVNWALKIAKSENIKDKKELDIIYISALLHDLDDHEYCKDGDTGVYKFLEQIKYTHKKKVLNIIRKCNFNIENIELISNIIEDADKLDRIGAIGIARAFTYGGYFHNSIFDPKIGKETIIYRLENELLDIKDKLHTDYAKKIAIDKHDVLVKFLNDFTNEIKLNNKK